MKKLKSPLKVSTSSGKLNLSLPRCFLLTTYKSFARPHLDCGDAIHDQPSNSSLSDKIESV